MTFTEYIKLIWNSYWMIIVPILMLIVALYFDERLDRKYGRYD